MTQSVDIISTPLQLAVGNISDKKILDIGCGKGKWCCVLRAECQKNDSKPAWIEGVDVFEPYINYSRNHGCIDELHEIDLEKRKNLPFNDKSFDIVMCIETLEHLSKRAGSNLIAEMERIAKEKVIITTPCDWGEHEEHDNNKFQKHKSLWKPETFEEIGYVVKGLGFNADFMPKVLKQKTGMILSWLGKYWKSHCNTIFAVKEFKNDN